MTDEELRLAILLGVPQFTINLSGPRQQQFKLLIDELYDSKDYTEYRNIFFIIKDLIENDSLATLNITINLSDHREL